MSLPNAVLISGASTGIGAACALRLAEMGWQVYAGIRREEDGRRLEEQSSGKVTSVQLDVTRPKDISAVAEQLHAQLKSCGLAALVNNAGIAISGPLEEVAMDDWRQQFDVNFFGAVALTKACLPMLREARGRIVNVSSVSGRVASPFLSPYAASKFALEAVSDALRVELRPQGIRVALVEPGAVATPIWDKSGSASREREAAYSKDFQALYGKPMAGFRKMAEDTGRRAMPVEVVVRAVVHALTAKRPRTRYLLGREARLAAFVHRLLPDSWWDALMARHLK